MPTDSAEPTTPALDRAPAFRCAVCRWLALALAVVAWGFSFDLTRLSLDLPPVLPGLAQVCGGDGAGDCRGVVGSEWGSVPLGGGPGAPRLPVAALGLGYFAFLGVWLLLVGAPTPRRRAWHVLPLAVAVVGALNSASYVWIMAGVLRTWCAGCLAVHVLNAALLVLLLGMFPWRAPAAAARAVYPHPRGATALAAFMAGAFLVLLQLATVLLVKQGRTLGAFHEAYTRIVNDPEYAAWNFRRQPVREIDTGDRPARGSPEAPHTVVMFGDYQCNRCRDAHARITRVLAAHAGRVKLVFVHCPLDRDCYPELNRTVHPQACLAATAAEWVRRTVGPEAFWRVGDLLYERQRELSPAVIADCVAAAGGDADAWGSATPADLEAARASVAADVALARSLGVGETPRVFLDGRLLEQWSSDELWAAELGAAAATGPGDDDAEPGP